MSESDFIRKIKAYLETVPGCFSWKEHGGMYGTAGIPDVICCYKGRFVAFEAKMPGNKPTALQLQTIRKIQAAGGEAEVVYSVDAVKAVMTHVEETAK